MEEKQMFVYCDTLEIFNSYKVSINQENTKYVLNNITYDGVPDIEFELIVFISDKKYIWTHGKLYGEQETKQLIVGVGLLKTITEDSISIAIDQDYLKNFITQYVNEFVNENWYDETSPSTDPDAPQFYDILDLTINYTIDNPKYDWYNFDYITSNIIIFNESAVTPTGTANFGDKYLPSFTMTLKNTLNLEATPYLDLQYFTLNACPFNFKFIDANGKSSSIIICGRRENDGSAATKIVIDTASYQSDNVKKISSFGAGSYTNKQTTADINSYITSTLIPEFTSKGSYDKSGKSDVLNILTELENGFDTYEEAGFDKTNIKSICVLLVETWDKTSITYKERYKAVIVSKFLFSSEK